jgi:tetratricopeptide (TPR) repeat protein
MSAWVEVLQVIRWPLCVLMSLVLFFLFFKKEIKGVIGRVRRVRKGDTEVEVVAESEDARSAPPKPIDDQPISHVLPSREGTVSAHLEPKTVEELFSEMVDALSEGKLDQGEELFDQLQGAEDDRVKRLKNEGIYLYLRYCRGDTSALAKLKVLAKEPTIAASAHTWLGLCYESAGDYRRATEEHQRAVQDSEDSGERAESVASLARSYFKAGEQQKAFASIMKELGMTVVPEALATLYRGLAELYKMARDPECRALALDKALESRPNDTALLFDTAYSYSEGKYNLLAVLHYETLLGFQPNNAAALNNTGVEYQTLRMPIHAVKFYQKAFEADPDNTLAAANLAYRYMNAGFAEDALRVLEEAKQQQEVHPNVGSALSTLSQNRESENRTRNEYLDLAREQHRFLRAFAEAYFVDGEHRLGFDGLWRAPNGIQLEITVSGDMIKGSWTEEDKSQRLKGQVRNRGAVFTLEQRYAQDIPGRAHLSVDGTQLTAMIFREGKHSSVVLARANQV